MAYYNEDDSAIYAAVVRIIQDSLDAQVHLGRKRSWMVSIM